VIWKLRKMDGPYSFSIIWEIRENQQLGYVFGLCIGIENQRSRFILGHWEVGADQQLGFNFRAWKVEQIDD
jgi:hypothetical protein